RAIAFELNHTKAVFSDFVADLNIKAVEPSNYRVEATFDNGVVLAEEVVMNLFERVDTHRDIEMRNASRAFYFSFLPKDLSYDDNGIIRVPVDKITPCDEDEEFFDELPLIVTFTLIGQASYSFDGL